MNPWNGPAGGCRDRFGVDFVNFYYRDNIAQRVTILSLYMIYGGTNWGWLAAPFVGSSYDYAAAISEDRSIGDKYYEIKNLGLFTRVAAELAFTDRVGIGADYTNNTDLFTTELRNPKTGAAFYVIRHVDTASTSEEWFALKVNTSIGEFYVPKISSAVILSGHEGKILVADFHFGNNTLFYATAEVLTYTIIDGQAVLVLWTPSGRSGEFYLQGATNGTVSTGQVVTFVGVEHGMVVGYTQKEGMTVLTFDNGVKIILVDRKTAYKVWVPALTKDPKCPWIRPVSPSHHSQSPSPLDPDIPQRSSSAPPSSAPPPWPTPPSPSPATPTAPPRSRSSPPPTSPTFAGTTSTSPPPAPTTPPSSPPSPPRLPSPQSQRPSKSPPGNPTTPSPSATLPTPPPPQPGLLFSPTPPHAARTEPQPTSTPTATASTPASASGAPPSPAAPPACSSPSRAAQRTPGLRSSTACSSGPGPGRATCPSPT